MNILVTGATGFIGNALARRLLKDPGDKVFCLVRNNSRVRRLAEYPVQLIYGDITDLTALRAIPERFDVVFHCAAFVDDRDPVRLHTVNVDGSRNIFQYALEKKVSRVVYLSSVAVVSGNPQVPLTEDLPYAVTNHYGQSKREAEEIALQYRAKGLKMAIIRPSMVYGPQEPHAMKFLLFLIKQRMFPLFNHGRQQLHMVYVETVVDSLIFALQNDACLEGTYFIADKEVMTAAQTMAIMAEALGVKPPDPVPWWVEAVLTRLPLLGKRIKFFQKDRAYSTERLEKAGFIFRYPAHEALTRSCQEFRPA